MILLHSNLIDQDLGIFLTLVLVSGFALIVGVAFHEFSHAVVATALGDSLPRRQGRVTLNPMAHLEPFGAVMMFLIGFGWGKPVQFNPRGLKVSPKTATFLVASAGPVSNFIFAGLLAIPIKLGWVPYINPISQVSASDFSREVSSLTDFAGLFLTGAVYLNVILGVFNLIPLEPLDGFKVALGMMPDDLAREWVKLAQYGPGIIMILLFVIPYYFHKSPLADIMGPPIIRLVRLFTGVG